MIRLRILAFVCGLLLAAPLALGGPAVEAVSHVAIPVAQLDRAVSFYEAIGFVREDDRAAGVGNASLRLGREHVVLRQASGRPVPTQSRGNDLWFQHLAIVVSDIDRAYDIALRAGAAPISAGPQLLPAWNPDAGGIRAVYLRDPDRHPLELIQYPPGKGDRRWQERDRLFLGIDHTAIAASDTERSLAFYRDRLELRIVGQSENWGVEQERLSGVPGAHVRIPTLRTASGPGIELLHYLAPRDGHPTPPDTSPDDLWAEVIVLRGAGLPPQGKMLRDPDGHVIRFEADGIQAAR
jgi:catechol 2,3-dioxygenase-like lactoylglutathione lyase family enzyme